MYKTTVTAQVNELFDEVGRIPDSLKVILGGDLNGHIGEKRVGYEAMQGSYSFGLRNSDQKRNLQFCD